MVTTATILITVFLQGGLTEFVIKVLDIPVNVSMQEYLHQVSYCAGLCVTLIQTNIASYELDEIR